MGRDVVNKFNRGEIDAFALARDDVKRVNNSASSMINFIPMRLGPMIYRPGTEYIADLNSSYDHHLIPFVAAIDDTAHLDFYNDKIEFVVNDVAIAVSAVTSTITNGEFTSDITGWTDASTGAGSTAWWSTGGLALTGDGSGAGISYQTISSTDTGNEHFTRIAIDRAPVLVKIGTSGASSFDIFKGTLKPGIHVLTFTPSSNITITFENSKKYVAVVDSVSFDSGSSNLVIDTPMTSATMDSLRVVQSIDIVFCAFDGGNQFQIEHRGDKSWSVVDFRCDDGPFESINNTNITIEPGGLSGDVGLHASEAFFTADHVGALFKIASTGQKVEADVTVNTGAGTGAIRVTGVSSTRAFTVLVTGTWVGTVTLQRSVTGDSWDDVETYTTNQNKSFNDTFDNSIFYYRLWVKAGDYTSGTIELSLDYASGSIEGICRVLYYASATDVSAQVLVEFGSTDASLDWYEGSWSAVKDYPAAVDIAEGRIWFAGKNQIWGSVSDSYYSFDRSIEGDSASILKTIGFGPADPAKWIKSSNQLVVGTTGDEVVVRSSSFGEILTPTTVNLKSGSNQGSANIEPIKIDGTIYFVQRSGAKVYSLDSSIDRDAFATLDIMLLNKSISSAGIHRIAYTRQPETRICVVLDDGNVAIHTLDKSEEVAAWSRFQVDGDVKDVAVLPASGEDRVYFVIERDGGTYLEKMAKFSEAEGGTISKTFDSFKAYTSPGTTITGLSHVEGKTVGVWADGQDRGTYTVVSGQITVGSSWTDVIVGLPYTADYVSNKLSGYQPGSVLTERKGIVDTGLILENYWPGSLKIGPSVALLKDLPGIEDGKAVDLTATQTEYNELPFEFDGETESDPRIYLRATGPVTILGLTYDIEGDTDDQTSVAG